MKVFVEIKRFALARLFPFGPVMIAALVLAGNLQAAQRKPEVGDKQKTEKDETQDEKTGNLAVEVLLLNGKESRVAAEKAMVRIRRRGNDPQETNTQGQVRISGLNTGKAILQVYVIGMKECSLPITITAGDQAVRVLVDKSQKGKCQLEIVSLNSKP
jgi:hypothetical protein